MCEGVQQLDLSQSQTSQEHQVCFRPNTDTLCVSMDVRLFIDFKAVRVCLICLDFCDGLETCYDTPELYVMLTKPLTGKKQNDQMHD